MTELRFTAPNGRTWTWRVPHVYLPSLDRIQARCERAIRQGSVGTLSDHTVGADGSRQLGADFSTALVVRHASSTK